jgi:exodeoxyribonuclease VII large subunit
MARQTKSQWDFGELFPVEATRRILAVSELTAQVKRLLEKEVGAVWVSGEVTNLRVQSSGHIYFTLKDASAQVSCVLFRNENVVHRDALRDGQHLVLHGELSVYEPRGQYQLIVRAVELQGVGALQIAFEKLKQKLQAEGLFAMERKRPYPRMPQRIGVVTSPTGAALRDVLHVIARRQPGLEVVLAACRVQGDGAGAEIAAALRALNAWNHTLPGPERLGLILVTRGGGSLEDLWAFNEEVVARAIFESVLPVMSAVGHEIDFTISDFVADVRAATPSAGAELITEAAFAGRRFLAEAGQRLGRIALQQIEAKRDDCERLAQRLERSHPRRRLEERWQYLDDLQATLARAAVRGWRERRSILENLARRWWTARSLPALALGRQRVADLSRRLRERLRTASTDRAARVGMLEARLRALGPDSVLARGYSITFDAATGQVIRNAAETAPGQELRTRLQTGEVRSKVK